MPDDFYAQQGNPVRFGDGCATVTNQQIRSQATSLGMLVRPQKRHFSAQEKDEANAKL